MDRARTELAEYGRNLAALLTALDSDLEPEQLRALDEATSASFDSAARSLSECPASERERLAGDLANLRRWAALVHDAAQRSLTRVGERLVDIGRARQALSHLDQRMTGESCNIAG